MPRRNLFWLIAVTVISLACYQRVQHDPYGRVLANAMSRIEQRYIEPVKPAELFEGAMEGMLGDLDDYSAYVRPAKLQEFHETIDQQFGGVGMEVGIDPKTKQLTVLSPLVGSPAYKAGILAGDAILRIDAAGTQGMSLNDAVGLLRGKPGSAVTLTVLHEGDDKPDEIKIVRDVIQVDTVLGDTRNADGSWNFFLDGHDRIGYVRITSFAEKTVEELRQALDWLVEHDMRGLVLDLRDNPGGLLSLGRRRLRHVHRLRRDRHHPAARRPHQRDLPRQRRRALHRFPHGRAGQPVYRQRRRDRGRLPARPPPRGRRRPAHLRQRAPSRK